MNRRNTMTLTGQLEPRTKAALERKPAATGQQTYMYALGEVREYTGEAAQKRRAEIQQDREMAS